MKTPLFTLCLLGTILQAAPEFAPVFQDHMVIQRDEALQVWGKGKPRETITVTWMGERKSATCDRRGAWTVDFSAPKLPVSAQTGLSLTASDSEGTSTVKDILIGDVWLASGQSNMAYIMNSFADARADSASFDIPQLRFMSIRTPLHTTGRAYTVAQYKQWLKDGLVQMKWQISSPSTAKGFSAVGAYFGQQMQAELDIPIGIICNAVGGSGMEAWISEQSIKRSPLLKPLHASKWMNAKDDEFAQWMRERAKANLAVIVKEKDLPILHPFKPSFLYNHHLHPISKLGIKGVIWYQGESNAQVNNNERNATLLRTVVSDFRQAFNRKDLPFYIVQLPRIKDSTPLRAHWAEFREVQQAVVDELNYADIICSLDLGQADANVHPAGKKGVATRLCDIALYHMTGHKKHGDSSLLSPRIIEVQRKNKEVILQATAKLHSLDGKMTGWQYRASKNADFQEIAVRLDGDRIHITLPETPKKGAELRYNYSTFMTPSLVSKDGGLPLFPWRGSPENRTSLRHASGVDTGDTSH